MDEREAHRTLECFLSGIRHVHNASPSSLYSWEELYRNAYNLVLHKYGELLYNGVLEVTAEHLKGVAEKCAEAADGNFIEVLHKKIGDHLAATASVRHTVMHMERSFVTQFKKIPVYEASLTMFVEIVLQHLMIEPRVSSAFMHSIPAPRCDEDLDALNKFAKGVLRLGGKGKQFYEMILKASQAARLPEPVSQHGLDLPSMMSDHSSELGGQHDLDSPPLTSDDSIDTDSWEIINASAHCYVRRTALKTPDGFKSVHSFKIGDLVVGQSGNTLEVAYAWPISHQPTKLVHLRTAQAELTVTFDHRVICPNGEKIAGELKIGEKVMCGARPQVLSKLTQEVKDVDLMQLRFNPDEPVETLMVKNFGILTKGDPMPMVTKWFGALGPAAFSPATSPHAGRRSSSAGP